MMRLARKGNNSFIIDGINILGLRNNCILIFLIAFSDLNLEVFSMKVNIKV